jgi:APA family basic amino acid/polyamine antiporter
MRARAAGALAHQYRQLPERLRALHPRFRTPYVAIVVFGLVACLTTLPGQSEFLGTIYAFGAMLSFTIAHLAVTALRIKQPDRERPYRGPGTLRLRGHQMPLFALVGGLGTATSWIVVTVLNFETLVAGAVWLTLGMTTYVAYRRHQRLSLTETHKIVLPKPAVEHEVEYESVLVAFEDGRYSPEAVSTAVRLSAGRRRGIHVLVTITVPPNAPIDADTPNEEARATSIIDSARVRGGRRVTGHWEKVRPGQAGRRIVEEAEDIRARAVVMSLPPRRAGMSLFGKTLETMLAERPCRIIIQSSPRLEPSRRAA